MWYIELVQFGLNLPGGFNPSEKYESQLGLLFPYIMENKIHVPKHQPETHYKPTNISLGEAPRCTLPRTVSPHQHPPRSHVASG